MDELFPNKTATAVELAKAEYYQGVVTDTFMQSIYTFMINYVINPKRFEVTNYSYDLGNVENNSISNFLISVNAITKNSPNFQHKFVYRLNLPKPLTIQDLFSEYSETLTRFNFTSIYEYTYDTTKQGDKDDFIKAVVGHFDPDFVTEGATLLYTNNGTQLDKDYGLGRFFNIVMITNNGIRQYNIVTPDIEDSQLVETISNGNFKLMYNGKVEHNFSHYQINVDLTKQPTLDNTLDK